MGKDVEREKSLKKCIRVAECAMSEEKRKQASLLSKNLYFQILPPFARRRTEDVRIFKRCGTRLTGYIFGDTRKSIILYSRYIFHHGNLVFASFVPSRSTLMSSSTRNFDHRVEPTHEDESASWLKCPNFRICAAIYNLHGKLQYRAQSRRFE